MEVLPGIIVAEQPVICRHPFVTIPHASAEVTARVPEFTNERSRPAMLRAEFRKGETWEALSYLALWLGQSRARQSGSNL